MVAFRLRIGGGAKRSFRTTEVIRAYASARSLSARYCVLVIVTVFIQVIIPYSSYHFNTAAFFSPPLAYKRRRAREM